MIYYFDSRKQLFEYDQALNMQRKCIYDERKRMFEQENLRSWVTGYADRSLDDLFYCLKTFKNDQVVSFFTTKIPIFLVQRMLQVFPHVNPDVR